MAPYAILGLATLAVAAIGCQGNKADSGGAGTHDDPVRSASSEPKAGPEGPSAESARPSAEIHVAPAAARWATWPMPNFASSGLPNPQTYDVSTPGTVLDRITGLMWQRKADAAKVTWDTAVAKCDALELAGYDDWRLPSRIELVSIVDGSQTEPSIDPRVFPATASDWFWTSSAASDEPSAAWYVYFYFGYPKTDERRSRFSVRCVRTAKARTFHGDPDAHYDVSSASVRDLATGLTWQRAVPSRTFNFDTAVSYCGTLNAEGHEDWRLPSMPELLTLVDERTSNPTIDAAAFPRTPAESFWTSSLFGNKRQQAWHVYFDHGNALYGLLNGTYRVRCVR